MKFKFALILSIIFHISIFAIVMYVPRNEMSNETTYYVDLVHLSNGSFGKGLKPPGGKGINSGKAIKKSDASLIEETSGSIKDLTVKKELKSKLRYPDKKSREKREEKKLISVKRKAWTSIKRKTGKITSKSDRETSQVLRTGISSSGQNGDGSGFGEGYGGVGYYFPYAYYIDTLRNKISSTWYNSLVSPGLRGKFITVVYFKIFRNGTIDDIRLEKKSGIVSLDLSALRAVENASPFAPLPSDFSSKYLIVHFKFEWEK